MNNVIMDNHGNQSFNENYYYEIKEREYSIDELVDTPKKVCGLLKAVIVGIVSLLADLVTIFVGLNQTKKYGVIHILLGKGNMVCIYTIVLGVFLFITIYIFLTVFRLLTKKADRKFVYKNNIIYKFSTKECPICGKERKGKVKVQYDENGNAIFKCNCDANHVWNIPYHEIIKMI